MCTYHLMNHYVIIHPSTIFPWKGKLFLTRKRQTERIVVLLLPSRKTLCLPSYWMDDWLCQPVQVPHWFRISSRLSSPVGITSAPTESELCGGCTYEIIMHAIFSTDCVQLHQFFSIWIIRRGGKGAFHRKHLDRFSAWPFPRSLADYWWPCRQLIWSVHIHYSSSWWRRRGVFPHTRSTEPISSTFTLCTYENYSFHRVVICWRKSVGLIALSLFAAG